MSERLVHLYIDLEGTITKPIISGWQNVELINIQKIKHIIEELKPDTINIFSLAIHDQADMDGFNIHVRPWLESILGRCFWEVPHSYGDIIWGCLEERGLSKEHTTFSDALDFWGKQEMFRIYVKRHFKDSEVENMVVLIDDVVEDEEFNWPNRNLSGVILNIDNYEFT